MKMKHICLVAATILCALGFSANEARSDYQSESDQIKEWPHWAIREPYRINLDSKTFYKTGPSVRIKSVKEPQGEAQKRYVGVYQEFRADKYRGKRVRFNGFIKTDKVADWSGMWMLALDADEQGLVFDDMQNRPAKGTQSWKKCSLVLDVPKNSNSIMLGFKMIGSGSAWLSDLSLEEVSDKVKTTAIPIDDARFPVTGRQGEKPEFKFANGKGYGVFSDWTLKGWSASGSSDYIIAADPDTRFDNSPTGMLRAKTDTPKGFATFYQSVRAEPYRGKRLRFKGKVKTNDVSDWTGLWLRIDGDGKVLAFDNMEERPINGTNDWKEYSVVLDVPKNAHRFKIGLMQAGKGSSWLSGCALETVGDDVTVTTKPMKPIPIPRPEVDAEPTLRFEAL